MGALDDLLVSDQPKSNLDKLLEPKSNLDKLLETPEEKYGVLRQPTLMEKLRPINPFASDVEQKPELQEPNKLEKAQQAVEEWQKSKTSAGGAAKGIAGGAAEFALGLPSMAAQALEHPVKTAAQLAAYGVAPLTTIGTQAAVGIGKDIMREGLGESIKSGEFTAGLTQAALMALLGRQSKESMETLRPELSDTIKTKTGMEADEAVKAIKENPADQRFKKVSVNDRGKLHDIYTSEEWDKNDLDNLTDADKQEKVLAAQTAKEAREQYEKEMGEKPLAPPTTQEPPTGELRRADESVAEVPKELVAAAKPSGPPLIAKGMDYKTVTPGAEYKQPTTIGLMNLDDVGQRLEGTQTGDIPWQSDKGLIKPDPSQAGFFRFPGRMDPMERAARERAESIERTGKAKGKTDEEIDKMILKLSKPGENAAKIIEERRLARKGPGAAIMRAMPKIVDQVKITKDATVINTENAELKADIAKDPKLAPTDDLGNPIKDVKDLPSVKLSNFEKTVLPQKDVWPTTKFWGDSLTILPRDVVREVVRAERSSIPRDTRIMNLRSGIDDARTLLSKLKLNERQDITLAMENMYFDEDGNVKEYSGDIHNPNSPKEVLRRDPVKRQILDALTKGFEMARLPEYLNAPKIEDFESNGYIYHSFDYVDRLGRKGNTLSDIRNGNRRTYAADDAIQSLDYWKPTWANKRRGMPGWKIDNPFQIWDSYLKQGMRKKYIIPALGKADAIMKRLPGNQPVRRSYYNNWKDTAMGRPYFIDNFLHEMSAPPKFNGWQKYNMLSMADMWAATQYVADIGLNLATAVKHLSPVIFTMAEHPIYSAMSIPRLGRDIVRIIGEGSKGSPLTRNPILLQSVARFYDTAETIASRIPKSINSVLFAPITFAEFAKTGLNFHVYMMMEMDKLAKSGLDPQTHLKGAYERAIWNAREHALSMGKLYRNEYIRNAVPRISMMFRQPPASMINLLWREVHENPRGFASIAVALGGIWTMQSVMNRDRNWRDFLGEAGLWERKPMVAGHSKLDIYGRFSPLKQAMELIKPSMATTEMDEFFNQMQLAKTPRQQDMVMKKFGVVVLQMGGVPIPTSVMSAGKLKFKQFEPLGPLDLQKCYKIMQNRPDLDRLVVLEELFRVRTRPTYWYH